MIWFSLVLWFALYLAMCRAVVMNSKKQRAVNRGEAELDPAAARGTLLAEGWLLSSTFVISLQIALFFFAFDRGASPVFVTDDLLLCLLVAILAPHNSFIAAVYLSQCLVIKNQCPDCAAAAIEPDRKLIKCAAVAYFIVVAAVTLIYRLDGLSLWQFFSLLVYAFVVALGAIIKALGGKLSKKETVRNEDNQKVDR